MFNPMDAMENVKNKVVEEASVFKADLAPLASGLLDKGVQAVGEKIGLPNLTISGAENTAKDVIKSVEHCAGNVSAAVKDLPGTFETAKNIPLKDWMEVGKAGFKVAEKNGAPLVLDGIMIGATDGMDLVKDVKLGMDVVNLLTSPESKEFAKKLEAAFADGAKAKQAKA